MNTPDNAPPASGLHVLRRKAGARGLRILSPLMSAAHKVALNRVHLSRNRGRAERKLEIGPGPRPIPGFEALNIVWTPGTNYVMRATRRMPFEDDIFQTVYASHVLEHIPWYAVADVLAEWNRIIRPGGQLEIWVPDGLKVAKSFIAGEEADDTAFHQDGWWKFNDARDPAVWANGRYFSYGDGRGTPGHFNWHMGMFSERYLCKLLREAGFSETRRMSADEVRGYDHGWINMGVAGIK